MKKYIQKKFLRLQNNIIVYPTASLFLIDYYATLYYAIFFDRVLERSIT